MVVHGTDAHPPEMDMVAADPDKYRFVKISDKRFTNGASNEEPIYHAMKVKSGVAEDARSVKTICVRGLLLANTKKLSATQRDTVLKVVSNHWEEIHP